MRRNVRRWGSLALVFISAWLWPGAATQGPEDRKAEKPKPTGVATGAPHAPVKDAMSRPITAGGFVDDAPIVFIDITKQAGLDKFHHRSGTPEKATILETPGSGVALFDYDNDGCLASNFPIAPPLPPWKGEDQPRPPWCCATITKATSTMEPPRQGVRKIRRT